MATEEQLKVTISTVADTAAVQRYGQAVQQVQEQGRIVAQRQVSPEEQANLARFRALQQQQQQQQRPATEAVETTRRMGEVSRLTASELARFGAAAVGVGLGLSAFTAAGDIAHFAITRIVGDTIELDRAMRLNTITLGEQAAGFQQYAAALSQQSGFTQKSLLEAGTAAQQFGRQIGLVPQQVQDLVGVSSQLSQVLGTDVSQTMTLLTSAMQGNGQAANALGLELDDAYVAYTQLGGASAEVFKQLDPATQATLRYQAALQQVSQIAKTAPGPVQDLQKAQNQLNAEWERFGTQIGPQVVTALGDILSKSNDLIRLAQENNSRPSLVQQWVDSVRDLNNRPGIDTLRDIGQSIVQTAAAANEATPPLQQMAQALQGQGEKLVALHDRVESTESSLAARATQYAQAQTAVKAAQQSTIDLTSESVRLQHNQVNLTAEQARVQLSLLPAQQQMAQLQRDITEQQIRAQQAALPASEALQDLQYEQQRAVLISQNRQLSVADRSAARRELRDLARAEPGVALTALQAGRPLTLAERQAQRVGLNAQLLGIAGQNALAPVQGALTQNQLVAAIVAGQLQAAKEYQQQLTVVVNIVQKDGTITQQDIHNAVLAADNKASVTVVGAA